MFINLLLALPDNLLQDLFTDWLCVFALGRLDAALCAHNARAQFTQLYQMLDWKRAFQQDCKLIARSETVEIFYRWLLCRRFHTTHIYYRKDINVNYSELVKALITRNACCIETVHTQHSGAEKDTVLRHLSLHCTQLKSLTYELVGDISENLVILLHRNLGLQALSLFLYKIGGVENFLRMVSCPSVTKLNLLHRIDLKLAKCIAAAFPNTAYMTLASLECDALAEISRVPLCSLQLGVLRGPKTPFVMRGDGAETHFTYLEELCIDEWTSNSDLLAILENAPKLHTITLDGYHYNEELERLKTDILQIMSKLVGARLQVLKLFGVNGLPKCDFQLLAECSPNLRQLLINFNQSELDDLTTLSLLPRWPKLTHFQVSDLQCSVAVLQSILKHCPLMESLTFEIYYFDVDIVDLTNFIRESKCLKRFVLGEVEYPLRGGAFVAIYNAQKALYDEERSL